MSRAFLQAFAKRPAPVFEVVPRRGGRIRGRVVGAKWHLGRRAVGSPMTPAAGAVRWASAMTSSAASASGS